MSVVRLPGHNLLFTMRWFYNYPNKMSKTYPTSDVRKQHNHIIIYDSFDYLDECLIFVV